MLSFEFPRFLMRLSFFSYVLDPLNFFCDLAGNNLGSFFCCIVWHFWLVCRVCLFYIFYFLHFVIYNLYLLRVCQVFYPNLSLVILLSCHLYYFIAVAWSASWFLSSSLSVVYGKHWPHVPYTRMLLKWELSMLVYFSRFEEIKMWVSPDIGK